MDLTSLGSYGIDYKSGIARCMDDQEFYESILALFMQDDSFARAKAAFERGDHSALFSSLHELKGACGNAALTALYTAVCPLVELLRNGDSAAAQEEIAPLFSEVQSAYLFTQEGIALALGNK